MRVVFAPDSFKGTATAAQAAAWLAEGWRSVRPGDELVLLPMADGGEGTLDAVRGAVPDARRMPVTATGPDDRPVDTEWLLLPDGSGVVELAGASGILLLDELRPTSAHTVGLGEALAAALDFGVTRLFVAIGGSASSDGGAGLLSALGAVLVDASGMPVRRGNEGLGGVASVDLSGLRPPPSGGVVVWSDVSNPLLGSEGAVAVFGAQKGVTPELAPAMEGNLARFADLVEPAVGTRLRDAAGAGAAGGTGFGLLAWGATLVSGSRSIAHLIGLPSAVASADLVVTGEGRFDAQSARGKVVTAVAEIAREVPVALVAGSISGSVGGFAHQVSLSALAGSSAGPMADSERWLRSAGAELAQDWRRGQARSLDSMRSPL
ncbi:glycerate kinase [Salinibacterium sp. SYSU T00001]|uniref:glycerate kinase n=1 Tax=Homoserinimonas sedimenticola TaxID=2986805 RepID=UPI0022366B54|nr:glycerate kinase [Salinibacterium sedimenticola]MCW4386167.1 glycerate kinase [Salinibacterium sedimenticola]